MFEAGSLLIVGFAGLWLGSSVVVQRIGELAHRFGRSIFAMGATVVAISTDLPELVLSIATAVHSLNSSDATHLISGNAIGSSVAQISLVAGVAAMAGAPVLARRDARIQGLAMLLALLGFTAVARGGSVSALEGAAMLAGYVVYTLTLLRSGSQSDHDPAVSNQPPAVRTGKLMIEFVLGATLVVVCSKVVVDSALELSIALGMNQSTVGAVILGLGTSLPELAVSLRAASEGKMSLSLGNIIGSNTFDLMVPVGAAALITPVSVDAELLKLDMPILLVATGLVFWVINRRRLGRWLAASALISIYAGYVSVKIWSSLASG